MTIPILFAAGTLLVATAASAQTVYPPPEHVVECGERVLSVSSAEDQKSLPPTPIERSAFTFYGDLRLRYELDWNSLNTSGVLRADRNRGRMRARAGANYRASDAWSFGVRLRSGDAGSQQSPHLTFASDNGQPDALGIVPDRYFAQFSHGGLSLWGGRNTSPFWQQNELFWDEDVTPTGLAGSYVTRVGNGSVTATAGAFYVPDGAYRLNGRMLAGQLKYSLTRNLTQLTLATGIYSLDARKGAHYLLDRNGERPYLIGVYSAQWGLPGRSAPLTLCADLFHNFSDYSAADAAPFPSSNRNQTLGYVLSAQLGHLKKRRDWLLGYYYAYIQRFAVNASYAQDDWVRFGNGAQTESSDFKGHEVRSGYAVSNNVNLLARLYVVEAITTRQNGNRFRLDLNWNF